MRRIHRSGISVCLLLAGMISSVSAAEPQAGQIRWHNNLKQGALESSRTKRPMLLQFTADWCGYCKKMKRETYTNATVIQRVNGCFVPITVDADQHEALVEALKIDSLPTTVIVSHDLKVLHKVSGFQQPAALQKHLETGCEQARKEIQLTSGQRTIR